MPSLPCAEPGARTQIGFVVTYVMYFGLRNQKFKDKIIKKITESWMAKAQNERFDGFWYFFPLLPFFVIREVYINSNGLVGQRYV